MTDVHWGGTPDSIADQMAALLADVVRLSQVISKQDPCDIRRYGHDIGQRADRLAAALEAEQARERGDDGQ